MHMAKTTIDITTALSLQGSFYSLSSIKYKDYIVRDSFLNISSYPSISTTLLINLITDMILMFFSHFSYYSDTQRRQNLLKTKLFDRCLCLGRVKFHTAIKYRNGSTENVESQGTKWHSLYSMRLDEIEIDNKPNEKKKYTSRDGIQPESQWMEGCN